jgi:Zn finger protein HypA/HybF involved in hydrogenase expression
MYFSSVTQSVHVNPTVPVQGSTCDISTMCLACGEPMREEHAHYRCPACGWRDSCCDGPY